MKIFIVIYYIISVELNLIESEKDIIIGPTTCHDFQPPNITPGFLRHNISYKTVRPKSTTTTKRPWNRPTSCAMKPMVGPCSNMVEKYYYVAPANNWEKGNCKKFMYGGCMGNGNRFNSEEECQDYCITGETARNTRPDRCKPTHAYGDCFGSIDRWAYNRVFKTCKPFIYSGCGGNPNNFKTREKCERECVLVYSKDIALSNYFREGPERTFSNTTDTNATGTNKTEKAVERMNIQAKIEIQGNNGSIVNFEFYTNLENTPETISSTSSTDNANIDNSLKENDNSSVNDATKLNDKNENNTMKVNDTNVVNIVLNTNLGNIPETISSSNDNADATLRATDNVNVNSTIKLNETMI